MLRNDHFRLSIFGFSILSFFVFAGCKSRTYNSNVLESPGNADKPELLGLPSTMNWSQLRDLQGGERSVPWSDSYWPLFEKGLLNRWSMPRGGSYGMSKSPDTLFVQISEMLSAWKDNDKNQLAVLSPAEKYDLLKLGSQGLNENLLEELKLNQEIFKNTPEIRETVANKDKISRQMKDLVSRAQALRKEINSLTSKIRDEKALILKTKSLLQDQTAINRLSKDEITNKIDSLSNSVILSLVRINQIEKDLTALEHEYRMLDLKSIDAQKDYVKSLKGYQTKSVELATKLAGSLKMVSTSWVNFLKYSGQYNGDWSWMGHCHGWAPASLNEVAPKHGVLVRRAGKEIFFTEGDIRGLLSKVYADQSPKAKFASQRCNSEKLIVDHLGRVSDGKLCLGEESNRCDSADVGEAVFISAGQSGRGISILGRSKNDDSPRIAVWTGSRGDDAIEVAVYPSMASFSSNLGKINARDFSGSQRGILKNSLACRDTNPMTFHMALKGLINDQKAGFVMDITPTAQVWNQPVFKWETSHVPIRKNDAAGTLVGDGKPVAVADVDDLFRNFRAPGTAFLVQVRVKVYYAVEEGPHLSYGSDGEVSESDTIFYTLELDAQQNLVGGEWGLIPTTENAKESSLASGRSGVGPDFVWLVDRKQKPSKGELDYAMIDKIHQCSLSKSNIMKFSWPLDGTVLDYTSCNLDAL